MAGIYIHIPFCKQACNYCNFYFVTNLKQKDALVDAMVREIEKTKAYLENEKIETIYFGGGTPSLLSENDFERLLVAIKKNHLLDLKEITVECNPDDLTKEKIAVLKSLQSFGIDRLSIGVQSFFDEDLQFMQRAHNADEAKKSIDLARQASFQNLTIDLIYGTPSLSNDRWLQNLAKAKSLGIHHLSCYALTVEPKTKLANDIRAKKTSPIEDQKAAEQFDLLMKWSEENGFEHYEISNFAKPNHHAIHNTNYWRRKKYLGIGPSAHSYNGVSRQWNVANLTQYIKAIQETKDCFTLEELTTENKLNEYLMTSLRTMWGCDLQTIEIQFRPSILENLATLDTTWYTISNDVIKLTPLGKHYADHIASQLFLS